MTGCVEAPFGILPSVERETSAVYWRSARRLALLAAGRAAEAPTAAARTATRRTPLRKVMHFFSAGGTPGLTERSGYLDAGSGNEHIYGAIAARAAARHRADAPDGHHDRRRVGPANRGA